MITDIENKAGPQKPRFIKLKLNAELRGIPAGTVKRIQVDKKKTPLDSYWRNRLQDAEHDNCVEIVEEPKPKKKTEQGG